MVKYNSRTLDRTFAALADPTRRRILAQLTRGDRCVTDVARRYNMSLPAVSKHLRVLEKAEVPSGRIYSIADIAKDLHYQARGMIERHKLGDRDLLLPGIVPKLSESPGGTKWIGPRLGEHTREVLEALGYAPGKIDALKADGTIGLP